MTVQMKKKSTKEGFEFYDTAAGFSFLAEKVVIIDKKLPGQDNDNM